MCDDKNIKELFPAYLAQQLPDAEKDRVVKHLASCEDCGTEVTVLRMMAEEVVPDPGAAYWAAMPDRIYRAVQAHKANKRSFDLSWFADRLVLPRWAIAAAIAGMVLVASWFIVQPPRKGPEAPVSRGYEVADDIIADGPRLSSLDREQFDTVASWAGKELSSIGSEAALVAANGTDAPDIDEELSGMDSHDAERLSRILEQYVEEV